MKTSVNRERETVEMVKLLPRRMLEALEMEIPLMTMEMPRMMLRLMIPSLNQLQEICHYDIVYLSELIRIGPRAFFLLS